MEYVLDLVQVITIIGLPASALLGIGIWVLKRDSRAPVQAVAILLIALGVVLWIVTLTTLVFGVGVTSVREVTGSGTLIR